MCRLFPPLVDPVTASKQSYDVRLLLVLVEHCSVLQQSNDLQENIKEMLKGALWLSGRVLDSRPRGRRFKPHQRHCIVGLEQTHLS